jgi:hypothetical protein
MSISLRLSPPHSSLSLPASAPPPPSTPANSSQVGVCGSTSSTAAWPLRQAPLTPVTSPPILHPTNSLHFGQILTGGRTHDSGREPP